MKTIEIKPADMEKRVARFANLQPLATQNNPKIPLEAKDIIYARRILSVIGLDGNANTPVSQGAPIKGAGGMTLAYAVCPPGQGPSLHAHQKTYETFTVMEGTFEITWNDDGQARLVLEKYDTVSVPPGVCRAFRNISDKEGVLQVIITGGTHDMQDIDFPPATADRLEAVTPVALEEFKKIGFTFTASKTAA